MYNIVDAIYQMLGNQAKISDEADDENPKQLILDVKSKLIFQTLNLNPDFLLFFFSRLFI